MTSQTQGAEDYFIWEVPGKAVSVHLHLDVVDRILSDVMRGFSAVPKRGAEVGGILLGTIDSGDPTLVRVDDFEPVETQYKTGPSYLLSDEDRAQFRAACEQWQPDEARAMYAVGFYRSNTRDMFSLAPHDVELMDEFFASPKHVALLIRPYGTRVATAGFFAREDGLFPQATPLEFPFRRRELSGSRELSVKEEPLAVIARPRRAAGYENAGYENETLAKAAWLPAAAPASTSARRFGLRPAVWIPLSFVFLLFGVALGLMIALARSSGAAAHDAADFSLGLSVSRSDDNLSVHWDREASAIHIADHGVLEIEDGSYSKSVDLDAAQLKNGSIIYRNSSGTVRFRLVVYPKAHVSVTETAEWRR